MAGELKRQKEVPLKDGVIYSVKTYIVDKGRVRRVVDEYTDISTGNRVYCAEIKVRLPESTGGMMMGARVFLSEKSVQEAFEVFEEKCNSVAEALKEAAESSIVVPKPDVGRIIKP